MYCPYNSNYVPFDEFNIEHGVNNSQSHTVTIFTLRDPHRPIFYLFWRTGGTEKKRTICDEIKPLVCYSKHIVCDETSHTVVKSLIIVSICDTFGLMANVVLLETVFRPLRRSDLQRFELSLVALQVLSLSRLMQLDWLWLVFSYFHIITSTQWFNAVHSHWHCRVYLLVWPFRLEPVQSVLFVCILCHIPWNQTGIKLQDYGFSSSTMISIKIEIRIIYQD